MKLLAFDVGGTQIKYALSEDGLTLTEKGTVATPTDSFDSFCETIYKIYLPYKEDVEGIAMSLPGPVDTEHGYCERCGAMKYPHDKEIGRILEEKCGCRVVLENDGKAATLAEHRCGSLKDCRDAAVFLIGTGIGGGLIINGDIVRGSHHTAGEFSFLNTEASRYDDPSQIIGNRCSTTYLLNRYKELSGNEDPISGREFFRKLDEDPAAKQSLDDLCRNIAIAIHDLCWLIDPDKVAIGGGISAQPILIETIREKFEEVRMKSFTGRIRFPARTQIVPCTFRNDANLIGACITYQEQTKH